MSRKAVLATMALAVAAAGAVSWSRGPASHGEASGGGIVALRHPTAAVPTKTQGSKAPQAVATAIVPAYSDAYSVLLSRNMFVPAQTIADTQTHPRTLLELKGIQQDDSQYSAYLEDTTAKRMMEVHVGDLIAQGRVAEINLHGVAIDSGGKLTRVGVGDSVSVDASSPIVVNSDVPPMLQVAAVPATPAPEKTIRRKNRDRRATEAQAAIDFRH